MKLVTENNALLTEIVNELETLGKEEQEILLVKLRAQRMLKEKPMKFSKPSKIVKPPSMQQINKWKHDSRK